MTITEIRKNLRKWFKKNGRNFYWRVNRDPYIILITEILLKKTTAGVVDRFLPSFLGRYPDIRTLYYASFDEIQQILSPLGLSHQRATQLKSLAKTLVENYAEIIPPNRSELLALPGVGDYTAGAVICFAFNKPEPIVDTNVARVLSRTFGIKLLRGELRRSPEIWRKASELIGSRGKTAYELNWAILDLGALICLPNKPKHDICPLRNFCFFLKEFPTSLASGTTKKN